MRILQDFAKLQLEEISTNISARRNKIFLLMEEVRRLRIQQRIKGGEKTREEEVVCHSLHFAISTLALASRRSACLCLGHKTASPGFSNFRAG